MTIGPHVVETCPACRKTFVSGQNKAPTLKSPSKTCPHCQTETPVWKLINVRRAIERGKELPSGEPVTGAQNVLRDLREVGIRGEREGYQAIAAALVGCYDRLIETTPAASHGVIDGVFGNTVKLAKRALGVVA